MTDGWGTHRQGLGSGFTGWEPTPQPAKQSHPAMHVLLFVLTLFSMMAAGSMQQGVNSLQGLDQLVHLVEGWPFASTLLAILTVHEFGHYFAARRWGVKASLPYFLPLPFVSFLGTLGAVIRIRSPIPNKQALLDIGAAGPLSGFVVAVTACIVGLPLSTVVEPGYFDVLPRQLEPTTIQLGAPLLFQGLSAWLSPEVIAEDQMVILHPIAFAGWVGLFITAFNLFPVGQLDGGHIVYALASRAHSMIGRFTFSALMGLGLYGVFSLFWEVPAGWPGWLVLALLLTFFGRSHPPLYHPATSLSTGRRWIGWLCFLVFALCFTPAPFSALAG